MVLTDLRGEFLTESNYPIDKEFEAQDLSAYITWLEYKLLNLRYNVTNKDVHLTHLGEIEFIEKDSEHLETIKNKIKESIDFNPRSIGLDLIETKPLGVLDGVVLKSSMDVIYESTELVDKNGLKVWGKVWGKVPEPLKENKIKNNIRSEFQLEMTNKIDNEIIKTLES